MSDPHTDLVQITGVLYGALALIAAAALWYLGALTLLYRAEIAHAAAVAAGATAALAEQAARRAGVQMLAVAWWLLVTLLPPHGEHRAEVAR